MILCLLGRDHYTEQSRRINKCIELIKKEVTSKMPKLSIIGNPIGSIIAFKGEKYGEIHSFMSKRDWSMMLIYDPLGIAFCITLANIDNIENGRFMKDLEESYDLAYLTHVKDNESFAGIYGSAMTLPEEILRNNMGFIPDYILDTKEVINPSVEKL